MRFSVPIILIFGVVTNAVVATPTGPLDHNAAPKLSRLLTRAAERREKFCGDCLLWCRNRDLAEEFSSIKVPFSSPPNPPDSLDFCSLRVKQILETDLTSHLNEHDPEDQRIKKAITTYVQKLHCIENDYAIRYGIARDKSLFLDQVWSPRKLAALEPDQRAWVEKKLDERSKRRQRREGENQSSSAHYTKMTTSQENEQTSNEQQSPFPNVAAGINRFIPILDAALRSVKDSNGGHQLGPSFGSLRPPFPVFAVP